MFDAIQQIDTDLDNLAKKSGDEFRKAIKEFHKLLQGLDTRGINKVELLPSTDTYITTTDDPNKNGREPKIFLLKDFNYIIMILDSKSPLQMEDGVVQLLL